MRPFAYAIAILVAVGVMYFVATSPSQTETPPADPATVNASVTATPDEKSYTEPLESDDASLQTVTLNVPEMHCPFACYPNVKKNLEEREDVVAVELAPQKEEGVIDNPQVIVKTKQGFQSDQAIAQLESVGFGGSSVVE